MDMVNIFIQMVINMWDNLNKITNMVPVYIHIVMEQYIKAYGRMIKNKAKDNFF